MANVKGQPVAKCIKVLVLKEQHNTALTEAAKLVIFIDFCHF